MSHPDSAEMTQAEFIDRFVQHIVNVAGSEFADGTSIADYGREVAPLYWAELDQRNDGPEACAESDIDCWERAE